jgi:dTDP-4-amino-4,6-dideoxygalactose transaminase
MVLGKNESALDRIRLMRAHGMTASTLDRYRGASYSYDVVELGYNYRMDELRAAVGLVQLRHLLEWNEKRRRLTELYRRLISEMVSEVKIPFRTGDITAAHLLPVLLPASSNREKIVGLLLEKGIQTSIHYPPVHRFFFYRSRFPEVSLPKTEAFSGRELTLPLHVSLRESDVEKVVSVFRDVILG